MKKILFISISLFVLGACCADKSCRPEPEPEPAAPEPVEVVVEDTTVPVPVPAQIGDVEEVNGDLAREGVGELAKEVTDMGSGAQKTINPATDFDIVLSDSIWVDYMIKHHDNLSLIAYNEYGNANEWRRIYAWNREKIGDNPNLIYPYHELDIKKPKGDVTKFSYTHYTYTVKSGETLWSIARKEYGDPIAWSILFWDNEKEINAKGGKLYAGMRLKVRSQLFPDK